MCMCVCVCVVADMREGERGKTRKWDRKNAETLPSQNDPGWEMGVEKKSFEGVCKKNISFFFSLYSERGRGGRDSWLCR